MTKSKVFLNLTEALICWSLLSLRGSLFLSLLVGITYLKYLFVILIQLFLKILNNDVCYLGRIWLRDCVLPLGPIVFIEHLILQLLLQLRLLLPLNVLPHTPVRGDRQRLLKMLLNR